MNKKIFYFLLIFLALGKVGVGYCEPTRWVGFASYYTVKSSSGLTASVEKFNENALTCAIWNIPYGTILKVTNISNNKIVFVRVNDRGVAKRLLKQGRIIDLTPRAFKKLAPLSQGLVRVKVEVVK